MLSEIYFPVIYCISARYLLVLGDLGLMRSVTHRFLSCQTRQECVVLRNESVGSIKV